MGCIYIVDDDEAVRDSLAAFLEACGYAVTCFASALALLTAHGEAAECLCILVDVHMPGMNGIELLEELRARGIATPTIFITAADNPGLRASAAAQGGLSFLNKPVDGDTLLQAIASIDKD